MTNIKRRNFIKSATAAGVGLACSPGVIAGKNMFSGKDEVSVAVIGTGNRGRSLLNLLVKNTSVRIPAICDVDDNALAQAQKILQNNDRGKADEYTGSDYSYKELLVRTDIDGVIVATPWEWHVPVAVFAMKNRKYVGLEVPAAITTEECWELVDVHEETGTNLMFLENCCYDRETMAVLQMLRDGLFGIPVHATCGYRHNYWGSNSFIEFREDSADNKHWRNRHYLKRNADLYPTHGIGPVANWFNINRGNRFDYLTSVATKSKGIYEYLENHPEGGRDHPNAKLDWKQGDIVTTIIKTSNGESIIINYESHLPRPYSRDYSLNGTKGLWSGEYMRRGIYVEGKSPVPHQWEMGEAYDVYMKKYDHPLWKNHEADAKNSGHGGIDYFMIQAFVDCVSQNLYPPIDVYDAATWSSIVPLSEQSVAGGSEPVFFPDFTKGRWINRKPSFGL